MWKCHIEDMVGFHLCIGPDIILLSVRIRQRSCVRPSANAWAARTSRRVLKGRRWCTWQTLQRCESSSKPQPKPNCPPRSQICLPEPHRPSPAKVESKSQLCILMSIHHKFFHSFQFSSFTLFSCSVSKIIHESPEHLTRFLVTNW